MEVYKSKYWSIHFEEANSMIIPRWNKSSGNMSVDEYKNEMEKYTEMVEKYRPSKALIDTLKFEFPITPDMQEWINKSLFPRILAAGLKLVAILMSQEMIIQFSLEQVMEEAQGLKFTTDYFSSEQDARAWLMNS